MIWYSYPLKCDRCGQFMKPESGASWVRVPATDIPGDYGDERDRCKSCTKNHGPAVCSGKYVKSICCGIYGDAA